MKDVTPITCFIQRSRYGDKEPLQMPKKGAKQGQGYPLPNLGRNGIQENRTILLGSPC